MKKNKEIEVVYTPVEPQNEEGRQIAERQLESAYNALFDLILKDEKDKK